MTTGYYSIITDIGLEKNANASANLTNLDLTHLGVGDSNGSYYEPDGTQHTLHNELHRVNLTNVVVDESNPNQLIAEAIIDETIGPFYIREVGIFDSDGDLFAIGKYPETFKPNLPSGSGKRLYIRMILGFSSTPNVNLIISDDINHDPNFATTIYNLLDKKLAQSQNLADLESVQQARSNLGLGSASLESNDFLVPVASIFPFSSNTVPNGYLECNGASLSRTIYNALFSKIGTTYGSNDSNTFKIPDLRGEFIRGFDNGRGADSGRNFGSFQSDAFQGHWHSFNTVFMPQSGSATQCMSSRSGTLNDRVRSPVSDGTNGTPRTASETRPRNIALKYIIKKTFAQPTPISLNFPNISLSKIAIWLVFVCFRKLFNLLFLHKNVIFCIISFRSSIRKSQQII
jgi:phage-related tail fiber protein